MSLRGAVHQAMYDQYATIARLRAGGGGALLRARVLVTLLACSFALGCGSEHGGPNVVLITIDTLRPGNLYGYERPTSRALDRFAERAVVFRNAYSTSSWTAPALASLLTSLQPYQHKVRNGVATDFMRGSQDVVRQEVLDPELLTFAEVLNAHGYATWGFSTNIHASEALDFGQGFDHFESLTADPLDPLTGRVYADARAVRERVSSLLERIRSSEKFFLWVHFVDPHNPNRGHEPWFGHYRPASELPLPNLVLFPSRFELPGLDARTKTELFVALYDSEIHFAIRESFALLEELAAGDETLYVITSDHGESFYEHGVTGHSLTLYEPELRVPMVIRFPDALGLQGVRDEVVSLLDVFPTVLDVLGIPKHDSLEGRSVLPLLRDATGATEWEDRVLYGELRRYPSDVRSVLRNGWKLIVDRGRRRGELFHLRDDPEEATDLAGIRPGKRALLKQHLDSQVDEGRGGAPTCPADPETREVLKALGYLEED